MSSKNHINNSKLYMPQNKFSIACARAQKEVLGLCSDGYIVRSAYHDESAQYSFVSLVHTHNHNRCIVTVLVDSYHIYINNKKVKQEII